MRSSWLNPKIEIRQSGILFAAHQQTYPQSEMMARQQKGRSRERPCF
jgi:hypothetical protein